MSNPEISFVKNKDIDYKKWDQCIENSPYGIVYAYSWYLDRICQCWDAIIWGDYLYVMPLPNNRKFGIDYIYQPFFTQQLGVFSNFPPEAEIVNQFLNAIPKRFRLTNMNLNLGNIPTSGKFRLKQNSTYLLNLQSKVDVIRTSYNSNTRRNIQKAIQNKVFVSPVYDIPIFMKFTLANLSGKAPEVKPKHYAALRKVISYALCHQLGEIYGAYDSTNNLIAAAFFVNSNHRCIYLAASSNDVGTNQSAMFLLIDTFISNNADSSLVIDFEGSNIAGIARFYTGFGAISQTYYSVHQNRLPTILQIFKK